MAKQLPAVDTSTDTFSAWINKTNSLITLANTEVVTANNHADGATTIGKGFVVGSFGSNTVMATTIRGGNTTTNTAVTIASNTTFTDSIVKIDAGATYGANSIVHDHGVRVITSGTSQQAADSFALATYRSAKYVVSIKDPTNNFYQATEIMLIHDGATTYATEYATISSNTALAIFSSDISSGNVRLLVTPVVTPLQINIARTLIAV